MIDKATIDEIFQTARVEEVIGEFVNLKKSGSSYKGLSPFSNERTPSFMVSPAKGIWKDFSTGKGGNVVGFLMETEHMSYPEALRWLANKYGIEIEEEERTPEQELEMNEMESLYVVSNYAMEYFADQLHNSNEGRSIGLSYFKERGFRDDIIEKFKLGYSPDSWDAFTKAAVGKGYKVEFLDKAGLTKVKDDNKQYDFFRGRIIFPIRNLSGRALAFGARTLKKNDKKAPKYLNSPETVIYSKSNVLYGIFESKKEIIKRDLCLLVEGYTDVVSMHQAGVENVVASSGTALTQGQIRLIQRYTKNITILYDGDAAGIRASFRGIDLILAEGLNVKVVLFPDGQDPDSYAQSVTSEELDKFILGNSKDFLVFKTDILLEDAKDDPIKRAGLVHEIVNSIALIPDMITRSVYIQQCSSLMGIDEQTLISALNKERRDNLTKQEKDQRRANKSAQPRQQSSPSTDPNEPPPEFYEQMHAEELGAKGITVPTTQAGAAGPGVKLQYQEHDLCRIMLTFGNQCITVQVNTKDEEEGEIQEELEIPVGHFVAIEMMKDTLTFANPVYQKVLKIYTDNLEDETAAIPDLQAFIQHEDLEISKLATDVVSSKYELSEKWETQHQIYTNTEDMRLRASVRGAVYSFKLTKVEGMIRALQEQLRTVGDDDEMLELMQQQKLLLEAKRVLSSELGRIIIN